MASVTATVVLNTHREAVFLPRTIISLSEAVEHTKSVEERIELVIVLDRPDAQTSKQVRQLDYSAFSSTKLMEVDHASLGLSRNSGIAAASGEFIITADADDLISPNYIAEHLKQARSGPHLALYFPQYLLAFGEDPHSYEIRPLQEVTPLAFFDSHPFISRVCAHRSVFERIPYVDAGLASPYAFEDWHFNCECLAAGYDFRTVDGTLLFYRRRQGSLLQQSTKASPQIAPSRLFMPSIYRSACQPSVGTSSITTGDTPNRPVDPDLLVQPHIVEFVENANRIEPDINVTAISRGPKYSNAEGSRELGSAYYEICERVTIDSFSDVFLFPFLSRGGAEKYFIEILRAVYELRPTLPVLVVCGEALTSPSWEEKLPPNVTSINLAEMFPVLPLEKRALLAFRLIQGCAPSARIHMRQSVFTDVFLRRFSRSLRDQSVIYYRFADSEQAVDGRVVIFASPLNLISDFIEVIDTVVCDSVILLEKDRRRVGTLIEKWRVLHACVHQLYANQQIDKFSRSSSWIEAGRRKRILWASRLDKEKRPELLPLIARKLFLHDPTLVLDAYGGGVFESPQKLEGVSINNLSYKGPYDEFQSLSPSCYSIFIYTSWCDGIPNVLLEAMSAGLAVIAPNVGGISELVADGVTGILLPSLACDYEMADSYVEAIIQLLNNDEKADGMRRSATWHLAKWHSPKAHREIVSELFAFGKTGGDL